MGSDAPGLRTPEAVSRETRAWFARRRAPNAQVCPSNPWRRSPAPRRRDPNPPGWLRSRRQRGRNPGRQTANAGREQERATVTAKGARTCEREEDWSGVRQGTRMHQSSCSPSGKKRQTPVGRTIFRVNRTEFSTEKSRRSCGTAGMSLADSQPLTQPLSSFCFLTSLPRSFGCCPQRNR